MECAIYRAKLCCLRPKQKRDNRIVPSMAATKQTAIMITQHPLTPMQIKCVQLIAEGHLHKTISPMLGITTKTVGNHIAAAIHRVKVRNATHLVAEGFRKGWIK